MQPLDINGRAAARQARVQHLGEILRESYGRPLQVNVTVSEAAELQPEV